MNDLTPAVPPDQDKPVEAGVPPEPKNEDTAGAQSRARKTGQILGQHGCLVGLSQLPGLVAMGLIKPHTANAIRGVYHELLQHFQRSGDNAQAVEITDDMMAKLRADPQLLSMLEPLLSDEQLQMVLGELNGGNQKT